MFSSVHIDVVADSNGAATVYLAHGLNRNPNGFVYMIKYTPGTMANGADLTITGETSGVPVLTKANAGTSIAYYYPRAFNHAVTDGTVNTCQTELIPIKDERIKFVVANGGNGGAGEVEIVLLVNSPY